MLHGPRVVLSAFNHLRHRIYNANKLKEVLTTPTDQTEQPGEGRVAHLRVLGTQGPGQRVVDRPW